MSFILYKWWLIYAHRNHRYENNDHKIQRKWFISILMFVLASCLFEVHSMNFIENGMDISEEKNTSIGQSTVCVITRHSSWAIFLLHKRLMLAMPNGFRCDAKRNPKFNQQKKKISLLNQKKPAMFCKLMNSVWRNVRLCAAYCKFRFDRSNFLFMWPERNHNARFQNNTRRMCALTNKATTTTKKTTNNF